MEGAPPPITELLRAWHLGDQAAHLQLMEVVYPALHRIAVRQMSRERPGHTLQPTALVHEAFVRLVGQEEAGWENREQFFAVAAEVMRRVLVDHARRHTAGKRGGGAQAVDLEEGLTLDGPQMELVLSVNEALERLEQWDPRQARIVVFRIFGGMTEEEIARVLNISHRTVRRDWKMAKAWLKGALKGRESGDDSRALE